MDEYGVLNSLGETKRFVLIIDTHTFSPIHLYVPETQYSYP
ncbi:hypothetical protein Y699_08165 [Aspergillus fumigatus Z5]|nr:hypothetical protein Y699_08165 [Aspergillus fumigatus Z5]